MSDVLSIGEVRVIKGFDFYLQIESFRPKYPEFPVPACAVTSAIAIWHSLLIDVFIGLKNLDFWPEKLKFDHTINHELWVGKSLWLRNIWVGIRDELRSRKSDRVNCVSYIELIDSNDSLENLSLVKSPWMLRIDKGVNLLIIELNWILRIIHSTASQRSKELDSIWFITTLTEVLLKT